ncbi:MAG: hypothetical protein Q8R76_08175 [Candidatus Omnitrophota bacterium]|nr:hypothetical protein [Candidatus Omnitrophota bacterium]
MKIKRKAQKILRNSVKQLYSTASIRRSLIRFAVARLSGDYRARLYAEALERPHYGYCVYNAALLAKKLGHKRISILEFGVAGGEGLRSLEYHATQVSRLLSIEIELYGFDTGTGLPDPVDYRDLPYHWQEGFFRMDVEKLKGSLKRAKLVVGDIADTVKTFTATYNPAPIAAIMFDLDFYSSTTASFEIFNIPRSYYLPRVFCYFDDVLGGNVELYNSYTGVLLAIKEFNEGRDEKKIDRAHYLLAKPLQSKWYRQIYVFHDFAHESYNSFIGKRNPQLSLKPV